MTAIDQTGGGRGDLRDAVENLLYAYAAAADRGDAAAIGRMFARGRVVFGGVEVSGEQAVTELYAGRLTGAGPMRHLLTNLRISAPDPDVLDAECTYVRIGWDPEPQVLSMGGYRTRFRVGTGGAVEPFELEVDTVWSR